MPRRKTIWFGLVVLMFCIGSDRVGAQLTSLTNRNIRYQLIKKHWVELKRADTEILVVDNSAIDIPELPKHRAGYSGIAKLTHKNQSRNVFVPGIAGLNFEHIHDGTSAGLVEKFEPRKFPMELRKIDEFTVELYQPPTGNWHLESCGRYHLLPDGTIEYSFECIPRALDYRNDFIGLFWASYIHQPKDKSIFFSGVERGKDGLPQVVNGITPKHGVASTHPPRGEKMPDMDLDFPLTLVNHPSKYEYAEPWYYGICRGMAVVQMFRSKDNVWLAQSPSGGGNGNPAWDFQWFIKSPEKGKSYQLVMRMAYFPFRSHDDLLRITKSHRKALQTTKPE